MPGAHLGVKRQSLEASGHAVVCAAPEPEVAGLKGSRGPEMALATLADAVPELGHGLCNAFHGHSRGLEWPWPPLQKPFPMWGVISAAVAGGMVDAGSGDGGRCRGHGRCGK